MRVTFVGVGEAMDERLPTTSLAVRGNGSLLLLDCGFTAAHAFYRHVERPGELDGVWISHFHGDHFFGLPALLLRLHEDGRTRPLDIAAGKGVRPVVEEAVDLAYPGLREILGYQLRYHEAEPGRPLALAGFGLRFAGSDHSRPSLATRLESSTASLFYSGDGRPTQASLELARGADLIVHEAYELETTIPGHGSVQGCLEFAAQARARGLALVHLRRSARRERAGEVWSRLAAARGFQGFLPEPGDVLDLPLSGE